MAETNRMDMLKMFQKARDMADILKAGQDSADQAQAQTQAKSQARAQGQGHGQEQPRPKTPNPENPSEESRQAFSMEDMLKMAELMQLMQKTMQSPPPENNTGTVQSQDKELLSAIEPFTPEYFENIVNTPALRSIKAALPYLEWEHRRTLGICLKLIELQRLMNAYRNVVVSMQAQSKHPADWQRGMIMAIRPYLPKERGQMVDMLLQFMDMKAVMEMWQQQPNAPAPPFDII